MNKQLQNSPTSQSTARAVASTQPASNQLPNTPIYGVVFDALPHLNMRNRAANQPTRSYTDTRLRPHRLLAISVTAEMGLKHRSRAPSKRVTHPFQDHWPSHAAFLSAVAPSGPSCFSASPDSCENKLDDMMRAAPTHPIAPHRSSRNR